MGKVIFWVLVTLVALLAARMIAHKAANRSAGKKTAWSNKRNQPIASETMVQCAHCGVHLPQSEALMVEGNAWCSQDHARLGVRDRS